MLEVMARGAFIQGPDVAAFESEFAAFCRLPHCVSVANGTDAIELALRGAAVPAGSEVILPANTFVATAEAVVRAGATPVIVDCDDNGLIDVAAVADRLHAPSSAVIPVHLFGQMADMEGLSHVLDGHSVALIEDAAQAQGARRHGRQIGSWGAAAATSFYPGKNLGAYGDGGAVVTRHEAVAERVRLLANHGSESKYVHAESGCNSRLDTLQAVVLRAKLARLDSWNELRRQAAARYQALLAPLRDSGQLRLPAVAEGNDHVWHLYVIRVPRRDDVLEQLHAAEIGAGIHYPIPVHLQKAFGYLGHRRGDFPVAEAAAAEIISLPLYPGITEEMQQRVAEVLAGALERIKPSLSRLD
jgi:dTDP-4-amino-4,6-dideoxygalactose transaminase